jgi:phosphoribosylglycinamide formyltransferase 1
LTAHRGKTRAAVLVSGGGTNLQAFIDAAGSAELDLELAVVVSSNPHAYGLERARRAGIATEVVAAADHPDRESYDAALATTLDRYQPDLVILAGFMHILTPAFIARWRGRILNIHPSLLPKYPGLDTHRRALEAGDTWHGCTVHFVTEELDAGPPIIQGRVPVRPDDTPETLAARVLTIEHKIYPKAAALFAAGRITLADDHVHLDGRRLTEPLQHRDN